MRLLRLRPLAALVLLCAVASAQVPRLTAGGAMTGFTPEGAARQHTLEARFDSLLKKENLREWMKRLSARPHHVGSPYDKENAEFMAGAVPLVGLRRADRDVRRALPDAERRACLR